MQEKFRIKVKTLEGNILVFRDVVSYDADDGLLKFTDSKTSEKKIFSTAFCEISSEDL